MKNKIFIFAILFPVFYQLSAQQGTVINSVLQGRIVDKSTKAPLEGAGVVIKGTTNQALTYAKGYFTLKTGQKLPYILQVSIVGYISIETEVKESGINIELAQNVQSLTDVVAVGYGTVGKLRQRHARPARLAATMV